MVLVWSDAGFCLGTLERGTQPTVALSGSLMQLLLFNDYMTHFSLKTAVNKFSFEDGLLLSKSCITHASTLGGNQSIIINLVLLTEVLQICQ